MRIESNDLKRLLRIGDSCEECPRWGGSDCKGHLQWLCRRIAEAEEAARSPRGVYECFHCGSIGVVWDNDFSYEDYGYYGDGIVQECHCENCGAEITYLISFEEE